MSCPICGSPDINPIDGDETGTSGYVCEFCGHILDPEEDGGITLDSQGVEGL